MKARLGLLAAVWLLTGCALVPALKPKAAPPPVMEKVDLDRYLGQWYVVANIPYFAESGRVAPRVEYSKREDGRINDWYYSKANFDAPETLMKGVAWVPNPAETAKLKVQFFWPITADYLIHYVDENYQVALVGHPSRDYAWVFSRKAEIDEATYNALLKRFAGLGYDTQRILKIAHKPVDQGRLGYQ
jgi:apolipoprotein D and lipocalin family protein